MEPDDGYNARALLGDILPVIYDTRALLEYVLSVIKPIITVLTLLEEVQPDDGFDARALLDDVLHETRPIIRSLTIVEEAIDERLGDFPPPNCSRCGRERPDDAEGWMVFYGGGTFLEQACPGCQTQDERDSGIRTIHPDAIDWSGADDAC
jgi:hypothetical protein